MANISIRNATKRVNKHAVQGQAQGHTYIGGLKRESTIIIIIILY